MTLEVSPASGGWAKQSPGTGPGANQTRDYAAG